jgi:hypothetical protein
MPPQAKTKIASLPFASPNTPSFVYERVLPGRTRRSIHALSEEGMPTFHVGLAMTKRSDVKSSSISLPHPAPAAFLAFGGLVKSARAVATALADLRCIQQVRRRLYSSSDRFDGLASCHRVHKSCEAAHNEIYAHECPNGPGGAERPRAPNQVRYKQRHNAVKENPPRAR